MRQSPLRGSWRGVGKRTVFAAFRWLGINAILRLRNRSGLPILCYHNVVAAPVPSGIAAGGLHLPEVQFKRQMEYLAARCRVVDLEEAWRTLAAGGRLPRNAVALTFDDGYAGNVEIAAPHLQRLGLPATIFLATDYIDEGGWYWWDELAALLSHAQGRAVRVHDWGIFDLTTADGARRAFADGSGTLRAAPLPERRRLLDAIGRSVGLPPSSVPAALRPMKWEEAAAAPEVIRFGGHAASHRVLDLLPDAEALQDARRCRAALDAHLATRATRAFCYPEGRVGPRSPELMREAGFTLAVTATSDPGQERRATRSTDPMLLPRIGVSAAMGFDVFVGSLAGARALLPTRLLG